MPAEQYYGTTGQRCGNQFSTSKPSHPPCFGRKFSWVRNQNRLGLQVMATPLERPEGGDKGVGPEANPHER
jgi:hypothetical protein